MKKKHKLGFTLIELLTVIAIIGLLVGILIPTTTRIRDTTRKTKTKAQFSQWAMAYELFKQEYGFYPNFAPAAGSPPVKKGNHIFKDNDNAQDFARAFTGKSLNSASGSLWGNKKSLKLYTIHPDDLSDTDPDTAKLRDAFGNTEIGVIIDINGDGLITSADFTSESALAVKSKDGGTYTPSTGGAKTDIPSNGIRASVIFYTAGKGKSGTIASSDACLSWGLEHKQ